MNDAVNAYRRLFAEAGAPRLVGLYIVGSLALDDFQPGRSDIDAVAVLAEPAVGPALERLAEVHRAMALRDGSRLDGVYATLERLRRPDQDDRPTPFVVDGVFRADRPCGDLNAVLRQSLAEHGIAVFGPAIATLGIPADRRDTAIHVRANLRSYWRPWIAEAARSVGAKPPDGDVDAAALSWGTLGVARIAATLETGTIVSKSAAGHRAMTRHPEWRAPLALALAQRQGRIARASLAEAERTLDFMRFIVDRHGAA